MQGRWDKGNAAAILAPHMRIAFFTDTFLPQVNGIATSIASFAEELGKRGHQVIIFAPQTKGIDGPPFKARGVKVVRFLSVPAMVYPEFRLSVFGLAKVIRALKEFNPDIIHFHTPITVGAYALEAAYLLKKPLVGTNHIYLTKQNSDFLKVVSHNELALRMMVSFALTYSRMFYDACDVWIAPSKQLIDELREAGFRRDMRCLPNGIPLSRIVRLDAKRKAALRQKHGLKKKVVLHFGRLSAEKRVDEVLRAFSLLRSDGVDASLLVIGDGPERAALEQTCADLGIADDTVFLGAIPHKQLLSSGIISLADAFVTASAMESQGMVIIEAMASGVPVIGVRQAAAAEVMLSCGLLSEPGDTKALARNIALILTDESTAKEHRARGMKAAEAYSVETLAGDLLSIYEEIRKRPVSGRRKRIYRYFTELLGKKKPVS